MAKLNVTRLPLFCAIAGSLQCVSLTPALAQNQGQNQGETTEQPRSNQIDDIVVTARRTSESMMDVPVAVTALSATEISRYAATDLQSIANLAPQVSIARAPSGGSASIIIRGIGSSVFDPGLEQSVSTNIDGVQVSRGRITSISFFDLQQVEILKGPQALFFGKNSPAGVISVSSADPGRELEGYVTAGYEFRADERYVEGVISSPITDTFGARLAIRASKMAGWLRNSVDPAPNPLAPDFPTTGAQRDRVPGNENLTGRLTLKWEPTDALEAKLKVFAGRERGNGESGVIEIVCTDGQQLPIELGIPDTQNDCDPDRRKSVSDLPAGIADKMPLSNGGIPYNRTNALLGVFSLNYDAKDVTLTSVTGYAQLRAQYGDNYNYSSFSSIFAGELERSHNWTQEFRMVSDFDAPVNFTIGAFGESSRRYVQSSSYLGFLGGLPDIETGKIHTFEREAYNRGTTYSTFGQLRWNPIEDVEVAGGVRWTHDTKSVAIGNLYGHYLYAANLVPPGQVINAIYKNENFSPEATVTWNMTPDQTLYAAYKTGYKSGGFSNPAAFTANFNAQNLLFGAESAEGGEIGYKAMLLDRRLRLSVTAYYYTFEGLQLTSYDPVNISFQISNAATARTKGIEAEGTLRVTEALTLRGSAAYNNARYVSFLGAQCYVGQTSAQGCVNGSQDLSGQSLQRAPDFSANLGADYEWILGNGMAIGLSGDANHTSSFFTNEDNSPRGKQDALWLLNASVRLKGVDDRWELALIGRNLTDEYYWRFSSGRPFGTENEMAVATTRPREITLQGTFRF